MKGRRGVRGRRTGDEVGRVGRVGAVPDPALVALKHALELELKVLGRPDLDRLVGRAGCEVPVTPTKSGDVRRGQRGKTLEPLKEGRGGGTHLTSGLRSTLVMYLEWAENIVTGWRSVSDPGSNFQT